MQTKTEHEAPARSNGLAPGTRTEPVQDYAYLGEAPQPNMGAEANTGKAKAPLF